MSDDRYFSLMDAKPDPNWLIPQPMMASPLFPLTVKRPPPKLSILDNVRKREAILVISTRVADCLESVTSFEDRLHCTHTVVGVRHNPQLDLIGYDWILLDGDQVIGAGQVG